MSITATNSGTDAIYVSTVTSSTQYFSLAAPTLPMTIPTGQSAPISVQFRPNAAGNYSATLTITSSASNQSATVALSGTGTSTAVGQLSPSPASLSFGDVTVGNNQSLSGQITNSGNATVNISQVGVSGPGFTLSGISAPISIAAGQSASFSVNFSPTSAASDSGNITITSDASNPTLTIPVSGTGTAVAVGDLAPNPASLSFGNVTVGSNQSLSGEITNSGNASVTISQVGVSGTGFTLSGITAPLSLSAGQTAAFTVKFSPTSAATDSGDVTITSNASDATLTIPVSGTGTAAVGQLAASPSTLAVGSVVVGTTGSAAGTLTASGANVTVTAASANNSAFTITGLSLPVTIPAGQSVGFHVSFTPQSTGAASTTLTFTSNAQTPATTESATGTGTAAPTYTVSLSWDASTSSNISGYNVYRAVYNASCGSFSKLNPAPNTTTLYSDTVVVDGTAYCYATTAVNSSNEESGYSNIVSNVQIPSP